MPTLFSPTTGYQLEPTGPTVGPALFGPTAPSPTPTPEPAPTPQVKCPLWPPEPNLRAGSLADAIRAIRTYYDKLFDIEYRIFKLEYGGRPGPECPNYPIVIYGRTWEERTRLIRVMNQRLSSAARFRRFRQAIWDMLFPGQHEMRSDNVDDIVIHSGAGPGARFGAAWATPVPYSPRARPAASRVAARVRTLVSLYDRIGVDTLSLIFDATVWPEYTRSAIEWIRDLGMKDAELTRRMFNLAALIQAWSGIPWPHWFFKSFIPEPRAAVTAFYSGYAYRDPALATTNYAARGLESIKNDIAVFIARNEEAFNKHFEIVVNEWIQKEAERLKKKQARAVRIEKILMVIGIIVGIFSAGIISAAIIAISQSAVQVYNVRKLTKAQVDAMEKIMGVLAITQAGLTKFRMWLLARIKKAAEVPPSPTPQTRRYAVWIEGEAIAEMDTTESAARIAYTKSSVGDRITIRDLETGNVGVFLRTKDALQAVPKQVAMQAQALSKASARRVAGEKEFPWWVLIPAAAVIL